MNNYDYKKDKADFVYDILCNRVPNEFIVKGMMYWYYMKDRTIEDLRSDMIYRSNGFYKPDDIRTILSAVNNACAEFIDDETESEEEIDNG